MYTTDSFQGDKEVPSAYGEFVSIRNRFKDFAVILYNKDKFERYHKRSFMVPFHFPAFSKCFCIGLGLNILRALSRRSEEHTSELQSRFDVVCRLLLAKKKASGVML